MFLYSCYDAAQVFRKNSFLKYLKEFDINVKVYPHIDNREEIFILIIENNDILKNCSFSVNAKKNIIYEIDYKSTKKRTKEIIEFYEVNIKNEVDVSNKSGY